MSLLGQVMHRDRADLQIAHLRLICQGLLVRIVQQSAENKHRGFVVAVTSAAQGAGVSHITTALVDALNQYGGQCAIGLDSRNLECQRHDSRETIDLNDPLMNEALSGDSSGSEWPSRRETLASKLHKFRLKYQFVLIDCPSVRETSDAVRLAPLVDGVILVVEANRTRQEQLLYTERTIEAAKGKILGHVLNKRTYVIPDWLSRRMEAVGL